MTVEMPTPDTPLTEENVDAAIRQFESTFGWSPDALVVACCKHSTASKILGMAEGGKPHPMLTSLKLDGGYMDGEWAVVKGDNEVHTGGKTDGPTEE